MDNNCNIERKCPGKTTIKDSDPFTTNGLCLRRKNIFHKNIDGLKVIIMKYNIDLIILTTINTLFFP